jgi:aminoglycoside phosphotransferase
MNLPKRIKEIIGDRQYAEDTVGMSGAQVICFDDFVLKIEELSEEAENEYKMMEWLADKLPAPQIVCYEKDSNRSYLLMTKLVGEMSCSAALMEKPKQLVTMLAEGLKMLWKIDILSCPCFNSIDNKLKLAEIRTKQNLINIEDAETGTFGDGGFTSPEELLQWLKDNKPVEELVFAHGDYCLPNIFIKDNEINGFIDLGRSGAADKYQDIALCYRSLKHNFDGSYGGKIHVDFNAESLFDELGIEPDWEKIKYYILLDELF